MDGRTVRGTGAALALAGLLLTACASPPPPLYEGLGDTGRAVSLSPGLTRAQAAEAQAYFDQGLALSWGFIHDEARRSFERVTEIDPDCAMGWWGVAYALGPNINASIVSHDGGAGAHRAAQRALALVDGASPVERALVEAMARRFAHPPPDDRDPLNRAYAEAMAEVWAAHPSDPLVGTLYADALMNINLDWRAFGTDAERGEDAPLIVATLERVLELAPAHAGAHHFYIHAVEGSDRPERALPSADRLESLMPAAGHMVHMPSHIYVRLGMYDASVEANARAVERDDAFFAAEPREGVYHYYRAHNHHFLVWTAMFRGSYGDAMDAARALVAKLPDAPDPDYPGMETFHFIPLHVMMRFGLWDDMLAESRPHDGMPIATALWHHGRAIALANTDRLPAARQEAERFEAVAATIPDDVRVRRARIDTVVTVARSVMMGEILFKEGDREGGLLALREGVEAEDSMPYAEPPSWMQPVRHSLGALLLQDGRVEEAEAVYRDDLDRHADNVWSLHGLAECLRRTGREREATVVMRRFHEMAARADVLIDSSCFCRDVEPHGEEAVQG